jgi:hypothetical protein
MDGNSTLAITYKPLSLIVAHKVTTDANDQCMLLPIAEAAKQAVGSPASLNVIADGGYSNGGSQKPVRPRVSFPTCRPSTRSTVTGVANYSTALSSSMTRRATPSAAQQGQTL